MKIDPKVKFAYLFLAKLIGIFLLFSLGTFCLTAPFYGDIIISLFIYLTAILILIKVVKDVVSFIDKV
jgi:hypothetical protein